MKRSIKNYLCIAVILTGGFYLLPQNAQSHQRIPAWSPAALRLLRELSDVVKQMKQMESAATNLVEPPILIPIYIPGIGYIFVPPESMAAEIGYGFDKHDSPLTPSPSPTPLVTPSPTPIRTATSNPTSIPTAAPNPTPTKASNATPSVTSTPGSTPTPSASPTTKPTPTTTPTPTPAPPTTPTPTATPTPTPGRNPAEDLLDAFDDSRLENLRRLNPNGLPPPPPPGAEALPMDIQQAIKDGEIEVQTEGTGTRSSLKLKITNKNKEKWLEIGIPPGTTFEASSLNVQNMAIRKH